MSLKVAKYYPKEPIPVTPGYENILIHVKKTDKWGPLSPYNLMVDTDLPRDPSDPSDPDGPRLKACLENVWQAKLYPYIPAQKIPMFRGSPVTIWEYPAQKHCSINEDGEVEVDMESFLEWKRALCTNKFAVRYPAGYDNRLNCIGHIWIGSDGVPEKLGYVKARKKIYAGLYRKHIHEVPEFAELRKKFQRGEKLQIVEVDGPDPSLDFPPYDQISFKNPGLDINKKNIEILIEDKRKPFGHGYVIACLVAGHPEWMD